MEETHCSACRVGAPKATEAELLEFHKENTGWTVISPDGIEILEKSFKFDNFVKAIAFTNQVAEIAEAEDHHPLLQTEWGKVTLRWWTHKINGLHFNDCIMAKKTDSLYSNQ